MQKFCLFNINQSIWDYSAQFCRDTHVFQSFSSSAVHLARSLCINCTNDTHFKKLLFFNFGSKHRRMTKTLFCALNLKILI
ncbi:hypothetical protein BpHYR1_043340 [Brachionus plicatilis]|uniref:Uncharacterized protein n=1 Tax=Brachionus plicatilis TaxID=10195 RepID=A0A3M7QIZ0_BRAPC|nr:hypothetical protein BpHYR1_043340 [Brachionus plicatilis]